MMHGPGMSGLANCFDDFILDVCIHVCSACLRMKYRETAIYFAYTLYTSLRISRCIFFPTRVNLISLENVIASLFFTFQSW